MFALFPSHIPSKAAHTQTQRRNLCKRIFTAVIFVLIALPTTGFAQSGSPFDTGFTNLQTLFTGTIAKVASLIAIVIGGYQFAHGEPGAKNFDHGYAVTSHSAQGLTAARVLINADTGVHPDLLNARFGYVSVSRASFDARIFTNDASGLSSGLDRDVAKSSATDFSQSVGQTGTERTVQLGIQL